VFTGYQAPNSSVPDALHAGGQCDPTQPLNPPGLLATPAPLASRSSHPGGIEAVFGNAIEDS